MCRFLPCSGRRPELRTISNLEPERDELLELLLRVLRLLDDTCERHASRDRLRRHEFARWNGRCLRRSQTARAHERGERGAPGRRAEVGRFTEGNRLPPMLLGGLN